MHNSAESDDLCRGLVGLGVDFTLPIASTPFSLGRIGDAKPFRIQMSAPPSILAKAVFLGLGRIEPRAMNATWNFEAIRCGFLDAG